MKATVATVLFLLTAASAQAQPAPSVALRGFADAGVRTFVATDTFNAILGESFGPILGAGIGIVGRRGFFGEMHVSRFRRTGHRVFVLGDEVFPLDTADTITITPVEFTAGYRWTLLDRRTKRPSKTVPYVGGGAGWHRLEETSPSSASGEDEHGTFVGYHVTGGAEFRVRRWVALAGEAQWTTIPNALGQDANGVPHAFGESNLGGLSARVKVIIGR